MDDMFPKNGTDQSEIISALVLGENDMRTVLAVSLLAVIVLVALWDIWCAAINLPRNTVSSILQEWMRQHPILGISVGVIIGHIAWPTWPP